MERKITTENINIDQKKFADEFAASPLADRLIRRHSAKLIKSLPKRISIKYKTTEDEIVDSEDDASFLNSQLRTFNKSLANGLNMHTAFRELRHLGLSDSYINGFVTADSFANHILEHMNAINPSKWAKSGGKVMSLCYSLSQAPIYMSGDEEERKFMADLIKAGAANVQDIVSEGVRTDKEAIELIRYQIGWLSRESGGSAPPAKLSKKERRELNRQIRNQQKQSKVDPTETNLKPELAEEPVIEQTEENLEQPAIDYPLATWKIYWTEKMWSHEDNHLVRIPSNNEDEFVDVLTRLGSRQISVKTASIARALKFHLLDKTTVQKALAARNKYCQPDVKDWIKVKRGRDRILIYVPNPEEPKAIFFAAGRDIVYRGI